MTSRHLVIERDVRRYTTLVDDTIRSALQRITENKSGFVFAVRESGILEGILTDGDVRQALVSRPDLQLDQPVMKIINTRFVSAKVGTPVARLRDLFSDVIRVVPLLDDQSRLKALARLHDDVFQIGGRVISEDSGTFVIAEIGINHNGQYDMARRLVDAAVEAGADCAKFQMRDLSALYGNAGNANDLREDLASQYTLDLLNRFQLSEKEMFELFDHCRGAGIMPLCTPWDLPSLQRLESYGLPGYKIASADLTHHDLIEAVAATGRPLICSTGMSTEHEIVETVELLHRHAASYALLHCNSTYPAPFKDIHLGYMDRLKQIGECMVGYSSHERGYHVVLAAVARGARIIEKHITLDRSMEGNDHKVSLQPSEFQTMVREIREVETAFGTSSTRSMSQGERMNRESLSKSLVLNRDLAAGEVITAEMIEVKSPGKGLQPNRRRDLIGRKARRAFCAGDCFFESDVSDDETVPRSYTFRRTWGIPVRFHDFQSLAPLSNPSLLEFHLSYKDLEADFDPFFTAPLGQSLVVHSPDIFAGDHLLDLASCDEKHRRRSVQELQRVVDLTRNLQTYFKGKKQPRVVASLGGFTRDGFSSPKEKRTMYARVGSSLKELQLDGVELLAQTLPPFPWYFGGQLYLNLFVDPEDTAAFSQKYGFGLCLDTSHTKLACNHFHWSFVRAVEKLGPHARHLHLVDARGVDGEGVQIGDGEIDFEALAETLQRVAPDASFIPEIWQGHKNRGEGFWKALERLEKWF